MGDGDAGSITEVIAQWALTLSPDDLPETVRTSVRRHLLDGIGCALAAHRTGAAPFAGALVDAPGSATVLGSGTRAAPGGAAFANGVLAHALDFDDTHAGALVHPTAVVLPVMLAVAQEQESSGADALVAAAAGYETILRIGRAVRHGFHARGFHATSACGVFAAALVAARLRRLDRAASVDALGIAGSTASGLLEFLHTGSATKQLHAGWAAQAGIAAATLAEAGASGPSSILEGDHGLYSAFTGTHVNADAVVGGLGEDWELTRIAVKPYPVCQLSHASLDALSQTLATIRSPLEDIVRIEAVIPDESVPVVAEPRTLKLAPRSPYEAKFSLPWDLAVLALDSVIDIDTFAPERLDRPDARILAERVEVVGVESAVPAAQAPGRVNVHLTSGRTIEVRVPSSRGTPDRRLDDEALFDKFRTNCGDAVDAEALAGEVMRLEEQPGLDGLAALAVATVDRQNV